MEATRNESVAKQMERKRVERIDVLTDGGVVVNEDSYLRSMQFHWWDGDADPYFYWDL